MTGYPGVCAIGDILMVDLIERGNNQLNFQDM